MIPPEEKVFIIRKLVEERAKQSLLGRFFLNDISKMSAEEALGCAEGTIVTIVESYHDLRSTGASVTEALNTIEQFRSSMGTGTGRMPRGCGLEDYIKYRVRLEHTRGKQMSDLQISRAVSVTSATIEKFFSKHNARSDRKAQGIERHERPSSDVLDARIWGKIDRFITTHGVSDFSSNRLHVVIDEEYRVSIADPGLAKNTIFSVPLSDLNLDLDAVQKGEPFRFGATDLAARSVMERLLRSQPPSPEQPSPQRPSQPPPRSTDAGASPSFVFMSELPHDKSNTPIDVIRLDTLLVLYYENVRTTGQVTLGHPPLYKYPQVAVVVSQKNQPLLIVRVEESAFGASMLCAIEPSGKRSNFGPYSPVDRTVFIKKVIEITSKMTF